MVLTGLIAEAQRCFWDEKTAVVQAAGTRSAGVLQRARNDLVDVIDRVRSSGDIDTILEFERAYLQNELRHYSNSPGMESSLKIALAKLEAVELMIA